MNNMIFEPISVETRLPDTDGLVVVYCRGGAYDQLRWVDIAYFRNGKWYMTAVELEDDHDRVTHWFPIPPLKDEFDGEE